MTTTSTLDPIRTLGDLLESLGGISPDRVWSEPSPSHATEDDVIRTESIKTDGAF